MLSSLPGHNRLNIEYAMSYYKGNVTLYQLSNSFILRSLIALRSTSSVMSTPKGHLEASIVSKVQHL